MNALRTMLLRVNQDIARLEAQSEVKVLWAVLGGSRRWGYSGETSDHDVYLVYENRSTPQLFDIFTDFQFSTGDGYNYTAKRLDSFLQKVSANKMFQLEILKGETMVECDASELISKAVAGIEKNVDFSEVMIQYRGMVFSDMKRVGRNLPLKPDLLAAFDPSPELLTEMIKDACSMMRGALNMMYYSPIYRGGVVPDKLLVAPMADYVKYILPMPEELYKAMQILVGSRQGVAYPKKVLIDTVHTAYLECWTLANNAKSQREVEGGQIEEPPLWKYYSATEKIKLMMEIPLDLGAGFAVNHVLSPLQSMCQRLYSDIQKVLR